jgi:putative transposase
VQAGHQVQACNVSTTTTKCNVPAKCNVSTGLKYVFNFTKGESLSAIVRSYKSAVSHSTGFNGMASFQWQSRFYDHIIRDEKSFNKIRQYIVNHPEKWASDRENPVSPFI